MSQRPGTSCKVSKGCLPYRPKHVALVHATGAHWSGVLSDSDVPMEAIVISPTRLWPAPGWV